MKTATKGQYRPLSSKRLSQKLIPDLEDLVKKKMEIITKDLEKVDNVTFTSDIWTGGHTKQSYVSFISHYIDANFNLKRFLLFIEYFPESHTGENISERLQTCISKMNLSRMLKPGSQ